MAQDHTPDGTFPTFPIKLVEDGESISFSSVWKSVSSDRGPISKLMNAVEWLRRRGAQRFVVTTDGSGGLTVQRRSRKEDGSTQVFSSVAFNGTTRIRFTYATALASIYDSTIHPTLLSSSDTFATLATVATTHFEIGVWDISSAGLVDLTTSSALLFVSVSPNLAGMT